MAKVKTEKIGNFEYARVADRLKEFRERNPRASIKTTSVNNEDGSVKFETFILQDKSDEYSPDATGSAQYTAQEMKGRKAFEKLETISVGRALSMLGYLNDGEIASGEEMEEFESYKQEKFEARVEQALRDLKKVKTLAKLKTAFMAIEVSVRADERVINLKDELKGKLQ